jgi:ElaB/YqjD/DUF883 family membrane-anchored ribosome-binding protein
MGTTEAKINEDIRALKDDVHRLRGDVVGIAHSVKSRSRNAVMDSSERVRGMMSELQERARQRLREGSDVLKDRGHDVADRWRGNIERRPLTSLLATFAVGMMVGFLIMWRRD